jgi:hypothetical protein
MGKMLKKMEKKNSKKGSKNNPVKMENKKSLFDTKEFLIKEKEYEAYLKHIEKLSRGMYNA